MHATAARVAVFPLPCLEDGMIDRDDDEDTYHK
jgi:hypothetical protein